MEEKLVAFSGVMQCWKAMVAMCDFVKLSVVPYHDIFYKSFLLLMDKDFMFPFFLPLRNHKINKETEELMKYQLQTFCLWIK